MAYKHAPRQLCGFHGRLLQRVVQGCKKVDIGTGAGHRPYVGQGPALVLRRSAVVTSTTIPSLRRTQLQTSGSEPRAGSQCTSTSRQNCTTPPSPCPSPRVGSGTPPGQPWRRVDDPGALCLSWLSPTWTWPCRVNFLAVNFPPCLALMWGDAGRYKSLGDFCEMMRWNYELQVSH